jgi:histidine phosphotransfer protein HptB
MSKTESLPEYPIDLEYLQQLSDGDLEFEQDLLQVYIEDSKQHIEAAKAAITNQDCQTIARGAHQLKGASGNVGAIQIQAYAKLLEEKVLIEDWQETTEALANLEEGLNRIITFVANRYNP